MFTHHLVVCERRDRARWGCPVTSIWVHPGGKAELHDTESLREIDPHATVYDGEVGVSFDPGSSDSVVFYANSYSAIADTLHRVANQLLQREARDHGEPAPADRLATAIRTAARAAEGDSHDAEISALSDALELALTRWPEINTPVAL